MLLETKMKQHTKATEHNTSRIDGVFRAVIIRICVLKVNFSTVSKTASVIVVVDVSGVGMPRDHVIDCVTAQSLIHCAVMCKLNALCV